MLGSFETWRAANGQEEWKVIAKFCTRDKLKLSSKCFARFAMQDVGDHGLWYGNLVDSTAVAADPVETEACFSEGRDGC